MDPIKAALGLASPAGARARLSIFIFHRVLAEPDPLFPGEPDAARFDEILGWIASWFNVLPLDEAVRLRREARLPARAASITFDDGYADNWSIALPLLRRRSLNATFFIATGFLDGGCMWNDKVIAAVRGCAMPLLDLHGLDLGEHSLESIEARRRAIEAILGAIKYQEEERRTEIADRIAATARIEIPRNLMMTTAQVAELRAAGMTLGAHTISHPILARISIERARKEIARGREVLREIAGNSIDLFAYPNGKSGQDFQPHHVALVRDLGFLAAVSTGWGAARRYTDPMQLPRFTPWGRSRHRFGVQLFANLVSKDEKEK